MFSWLRALDPPIPFPLSAALTLNVGALALAVGVANWIKLDEIRRRVREVAGRDPETGIQHTPAPRLRALLRRLETARARVWLFAVGGFLSALWYAGAANLPALVAAPWYGTVAKGATWLCALSPLRTPVVPGGSLSGSG